MLNAGGAGTVPQEKNGRRRSQTLSHLRLQAAPMPRHQGVLGLAGSCALALGAEGAAGRQIAAMPRLLAANLFPPTLGHMGRCHFNAELCQSPEEEEGRCHRPVPTRRTIQHNVDDGPSREGQDPFDLLDDEIVEQVGVPAIQEGLHHSGMQTQMGGQRGPRRQAWTPHGRGGAARPRDGPPHRRGRGGTGPPPSRAPARGTFWRGTETTHPTSCCQQPAAAAPGA